MPRELAQALHILFQKMQADLLMPQAVAYADATGLHATSGVKVHLPDHHYLYLGLFYQICETELRATITLLVACKLIGFQRS